MPGLDPASGMGILKLISASLKPFSAPGATCTSGSSPWAFLAIMASILASRRDPPLEVLQGRGLRGRTDLDLLEGFAAGFGVKEPEPAGGGHTEHAEDDEELPADVDEGGRVKRPSAKLKIQLDSAASDIPLSRGCPGDQTSAA